MLNLTLHTLHVDRPCLELKACKQRRGITTTALSYLPGAGRCKAVCSSQGRASTRQTPKRPPSNFTPTLDHTPHRCHSCLAFFKFMSPAVQECP